MKTRLKIVAGALALAAGGWMAVPLQAANDDPAVAAAPDRGHLQDAREHVTEAAQLVDMMKSNPRLADAMTRAKGILLVPDYGRGGFIVAGQGGKAVLVTRQPDGSWSGPIFYTIGGISIGLQAGAEGGSIAMLLMTDRAVNSFREQNNFALNADAGFTLINYSARAEASIGKGDVVIWSNAKGAFAGASLGATDVNFDEQETTAWYGGTPTPAEVMRGNLKGPESSPLQQALPG